jgi:hypothetical protein
VLDADGPDLDLYLQAAGVERAERCLVARRVGGELAVTGGVVAFVRCGEQPD